MIRIFSISALLVLLTFHTTLSSAQAISEEKSARTAAMNDSRFIAANIEDNEGAMFLSLKGKERAANERVRELAEQMFSDYTGILYEFEQLKTAGNGSSNQGAGTSGSTNKRIAEVYAKISGVSGSDFDTTWVANLLNLQQEKELELSQAKETVRNEQLKMVITRAIPMIRKHVSQLRTLLKFLIKMDLQEKKEAARKLKNE